jgi:hypothetical protein
MVKRLNWEAVYKDGQTYKESELLTTDKIDRSQLSEFRLFDGDKIIFNAFFKNPNRKLIFRRRVFLNASGQVKDIVYLIGWHENVKGVSVKSICYIYNDGRVEFDDDRSDLELTKFE